MTVFLTDGDVRTVFDWTSAITALREAYAAGVEAPRYPSRTMARGDGAWIRTLSGVPAQTGLMGAKMIAFSAEARAAYLIPLFDQRTASLVALLDGHSVTGYRTAATSALAADLLAPPSPLDVAVIGSGFEARNHIRAVAALRTLKCVRIYSPRPESRTRLVHELADLPCEVLPAPSPQDAVDGASLVICAARSWDESPTLRAEWLDSPTTIVSIGSTLPEQRELDVKVLERADLVVADNVEEVLHDTGDLLAALADGVDVSARTISLTDLVRGSHPGRVGPEQMIVYKSVGSAVQDLAVATMCVRRAEELGAGTVLRASIEPVSK